MKTYRIAMIGFGNVGQGFATILQNHASMLAETHGVAVQIVAVSTRSKGSVYHPDGLDLNALMTAVTDDGNFDRVDALYRDWDALKIIAESNADVIAEISYTDLKTGEPAYRHIRQALDSGKHVITANKGPTALFYPELLQSAREKNLSIGVEGTVLSGTPAVQLGLDLLMGAGITRVQGILNGTTNYILTQMETGATYKDALAEAQAKGYAEADPSGDVDGHDAAGKVVIIGNLLLGLPLTMADVDLEGISGITSADIQTAEANGERWKLIGMVEKLDDGFVAQVKPTRLPITHPLAGVSGATNAITYSTALLGDVTLIGPGAGRIETGYALIGDLLAIHRQYGAL